MTIGQHMTEFAGRPVRDYAGEDTLSPHDSAYAVRIDWDEWDGGRGAEPHLMIQKLEKLAAATGGELTHLVIGAWGEQFEGGGAPEGLVQAILRLFPKLRHLFYGDLTYEETEITWIQNGDHAPMVHGLTQLVTYGVRGGTGLRFEHFEHPRLQRLIVETGGLSGSTIQDIFDADLPELTDLELWLGVPDYGGDASVELLMPLISGRLFPNLSRLALRNSEIADEIAIALAASPILERISTLDLSLGTLTDAGATALIESEGVRELDALVIHHHFCSSDMVERLRAMPLTVSIEAPQQAETYRGEEYRYTAVSE